MQFEQCVTRSLKKPGPTQNKDNWKIAFELTLWSSSPCHRTRNFYHFPPMNFIKLPACSTCYNPHNLQIPTNPPFLDRKALSSVVRRFDLKKFINPHRLASFESPTGSTITDLQVPPDRPRLGRVLCLDKFGRLPVMLWLHGPHNTGHPLLVSTDCEAFLSGSNSSKDVKYRGLRAIGL